MSLRLSEVWRRLPVVVRAILVGFAVILAGIPPWSALAGANLKMVPSVPWAVVVELLYLWILWQYFSGKGWPDSTASTRRKRLRANPVRGRLLTWTAIAGGLFASGLIAFSVVGWMLGGISSAVVEEFATLRRLPFWTVVPLLLMGAVVTGLIEEAAFRGYMQVPIEQHHGPVIAIGGVAVIFAIAHFPSALALPGFILGAVGWGVLAYLADSILPGVVLHAMADAAVWMWVWRNPQSVERLFTASVLQGNSDLPFAVAVGLTLILGMAAAVAFMKLARVRQVEWSGREAF